MLTNPRLRNSFCLCLMHIFSWFWYVDVHLLILADLLLTLTLFVQDGFSALHAASQNGHDNAVEILIASKADPNLQSTVSFVVTVYFPNYCSCIKYVLIVRVTHTRYLY